MARYLFGDEIDRWEGDVGGEGDPVKLAENRTTTYRYNRKMYYASSPVRAGTSRIWKLYEQGTQCVVEVPCPHCYVMHELTGEHFHRSEEHTSELQSLMRISYAVFCLKKKKKPTTYINTKYNQKPKT